MKRTISILMAALMLTGMLTACSGTVGMDDGRAYGNVSTTNNGRVNGTNDYYNGQNDSSRYGTSYQNGGTYGTGGYQSGGAYRGGGSYGSANGYQDSNYGTGMTGGR